MITTNSPRCTRLIEQLRADLARAGVHAYRVASRVPMHPMRLSRLLNGHDKVTDELAMRIRAAIEEEVHAIATPHDRGPNVG